MNAECRAVLRALRRVACGRAPRDPGATPNWLGYGTLLDAIVSARLYCDGLPNPWWSASNDERRMFILFCAEQLQGEYEVLP